MIGTEFSYVGNALEAAGIIGMFFIGKRRGRDEARDETIETLQGLVQALKTKVDLLETEKRDQAVLIEKQAVWIEYLKGMVLGANTNLVPPGTLPDLRGTGRGGSAPHPKSGNG